MPLLQLIYFWYCYEKDVILSLSDHNQSDVIEAFDCTSRQSEVIEVFNSTSRYLEDLLNIDNNIVDNMVNHFYPSELQLNKANVSDTEASFFGFTFICIRWF